MVGGWMWKKKKEIKQKKNSRRLRTHTISQQHYMYVMYECRTLCSIYKEWEWKPARTPTNETNIEQNEVRNNQPTNWRDSDFHPLFIRLYIYAYKKEKDIKILLLCLWCVHEQIHTHTPSFFHSYTHIFLLLYNKKSPPQRSWLSYSILDFEKQPTFGITLAIHFCVCSV